MGEQGGGGEVRGKHSSFTAGEEAREQEGRYTLFVKPCFGSAQPAFSDACLGAKNGSFPKRPCSGEL